MSNKPFDLEKALAGEPVKLRDGSKAYVKYVMPDDYKGAHPLRGIYCCAISDTNYADVIWTKDGNSFHSRPDNDLDIIGMWEEPRPRVPLDLPCPLKEVSDEQMLVYVIELRDGKAFIKEQFSSFYRNADYLYFATKEDAQEWLDAMRNARR